MNPITLIKIKKKKIGEAQISNVKLKLRLSDRKLDTNKIFNKLAVASVESEHQHRRQRPPFVQAQLRQQ